jgi:hypothetical protein
MAARRAEVAPSDRRALGVSARAAIRGYYRERDTRPLLARLGLLRLAARRLAARRLQGKAARKAAPPHDPFRAS